MRELFGQLAAARADGRAGCARVLTRRRYAAPLIAENRMTVTVSSSDTSLL